MNRGIKIRLIEVNGRMEVPPECMRILKDFGEHVRVCERCYWAYKGMGGFCDTGMAFLRELADQPEVQPITTKEGA